MTCGHRVQLKCFLAGLVIATTMMCLDLLLSHHRTDSSNVPNFNIDAMRTAYHATREQNHSAMDITTELPRTSVLCHSFTARLGNIMFQYASSLALAKHLNASLVLLNDWRLQGLLQQPHATDSALKQRSQKARKIRARWCCAFDKRLLNLSPGRDYFLTGFLQSWKYFVKYDSEIRQALTFRDEVVATATKIVQSLQNAHRGVLVGVHVRRGDYTRSDRVKQGYKMAPVGYFLKAMAFFKSMYGYKNKANSAFKSRNYTLVPRKAKNANRNPKNHHLHTQNVTFIVACQDRDWCKQNLRPEDNGIKFLAGNNPPEVDMLSLSMLDHVIISVGTYSWWVGYLNTGIVVHYKDFIVRGTKIGNGYGPNGSTEWMLPHWIPM